MRESSRAAGHRCLPGNIFGPFLYCVLYWCSRSPYRWIAYRVLPVTGHFITAPSCWYSVYQATWICVCISSIQLFSKWAVLAIGQHAVTFLPNPPALPAGCSAHQAPVNHSISCLSVPSTAIVLYQVLLLVCCLLLYTSGYNCLWKWLLKCISPLLFRTSEGHLVKSMTRTSYFWVPHSISKRWL